MEPKKQYVKKTKRNALSDSMPDEEFVLEFCEGNPGCATAVARIAEYVELHGVIKSPKVLLVQLVDMNIRGAQLYVLFTAVFHGNVNKMVDAILKRDVEMLKQLNAIMHHPDDEKNVIPYHQVAIEKGWKP